MFNFIQKKIEEKIQNLNVVKVVKAAMAAQDVEFSYEEFVDVVNECLKEQGNTWPCRVARYGRPMSADEVRDALMRKAGLLRHIPWVRRKIDAIAKECDGKTNQAFYAETTTVEQGFKDEVVLYYNLFQNKWWGINPDIRDWRLAVREIIRHEYRHVEQFKELRRRGGSDYVLCALTAHMRVNIFNYRSDPMEADAYANQAFAPSEQSDVRVAVDKIVSNF